MGDGDGFDWTDVEFLDPEAADAGGVVWLDEEGLGAGQDPASMPPHATRARVLASLLALGLFLAGTGSAAAAAYHRHVTDRRIADEFVLRPVPGAPQIPDLATLGFASTWHARVTERVLVSVVDSSPKPVVLLDAVLAEPGLVTAAPLVPVGPVRLQQGQTGQFAGTVTADCTLASAVVAVGVLTSGGGRDATVESAGLRVQARTSGGTTATALVNPENTNPDLQERICGQEGDELTGTERLTGAADPRTHTVTIRLATKADADVPVEYTASAIYTTDPSYEVPSLVISALMARSPVAGTVAPGGTLMLNYLIQVRSCPSQPLPRADEVDLQMDFSVDGTLMQTATQIVRLDPLLAEACG